MYNERGVDPAGTCFVNGWLRKYRMRAGEDVFLTYSGAMLSFSALLLVFGACGPQWADTGHRMPEDANGDGVSAEVDCDDSDPRVAPGLPEVCSGADDDCDGLIDDADDDLSAASIWLDADGDGCAKDKQGPFLRFRQVQRPRRCAKPNPIRVVHGEWRGLFGASIGAITANPALR